MKLWHDDVRIPPRGWVWAINNEAAKAALETGCVTEISLDHDLGGVPGDNYLVRGTADETGYDLALWMHRERIYPAKINVHSMSVTGGQRILDVFRSAPVPTRVTREIYDPKWSMNDPD